MPGPVPAIVSLIGSSLGPVLIFLRSSAMTSASVSAQVAAPALGCRRMFLPCASVLLRGGQGPPIYRTMTRSLPILPLRDIVVFPQRIVPLFVGREKSVAALEA